MFVNNGSDEATVNFLKKSVSFNNNKPTKKIITLEGSPRYIENIEKMLGYMQWLGDVGHSTSFKVYVDGDGAFRLNMKSDGKPLYTLMRTPEMKEFFKNNDDIDEFNFE
jgi:hypothetical protein